MELRRIDFSKGSFKANGTEYFIKNTLTFKRFSEYEKLQNHFAFGLSFGQIYDRLSRAIAYANSGKGVEAWNVIYNLRDGIAQRNEKDIHPAMLLCSLFIVTKDEDLAKWDEQDQAKKFEDWNKERIDAQDFFTLASNFVARYLEILKEISQNISKAQRGEA